MFHCLLFNLYKSSSGYLSRSAGVHRIANHLREQGWDSEVIDFAQYWTYEQLIQLVDARVTKNTKFIGFSHMFQLSPWHNWPKHIEELCAYVKQTHPDIIIITGSQNNPNFYSKHIDYSVTGYGEYALDALLKYKFSNGPRPVFDLNRGLSGQQLIHGLDSYPAHPMREPSLTYEDRDFIYPGEWSTIEFSRGCKFSCSFCNFPVLGVKGDYTRSAEGFRNQMMINYDRFGIENYIVSDETFNDSTEKIAKFADVVETLPWKPYFTGFLRADLLVSRPRDKEELLRMGFLGHFYGIETFNHDTGKIIGKGMNPDKLQQGLLDVKKYLSENSNDAYRAVISIIYGLPLETKETLKKTEEWLLKNWIDQVVIAWGLDLSDNDLGVNHSKLSMNYAKYGYRKKEGPYDYRKFPTTFHTTPSKAYLLEGQEEEKNQLVNWENDHMDLYYATAGAAKFRQNFLKLGGFGLGNILVNRNTGMSATIRERLDMGQMEAAFPGDHAYTDYEKFAQNYINKKLSI